MNDNISSAPSASSPDCEWPDVITIGDHDFARGQKGSVDLAIGSLIDYQPVTMTVHVHRSRKPGPCLLVAAGVHGDEIIGIEVIRRLLKTRLLSRLRGTLIAIPVVNMPAYLSRSRYLPDRRDLNRLFPGSKTGSLGGRLAEKFVSEVIPHCNHAIDMHTGAVGRPNLPQIRVTAGDAVGMEMAKAFHPPVVIESALREGSLRATLFANSCPSILYEAGEAHRLDPTAVSYGLRGILSVMRHLGNLPPDKKAKPRRHQTITSPNTGWVRAPRGGIFTPKVELGQAVSSDGILGFVADPFGRHETPIKTRMQGIIIGLVSEGTVDEGDGLFHIASTTDPDRAEAQLSRNHEVLEDFADPYF